MTPNISSSNYQGHDVTSRQSHNCIPISNDHWPDSVNDLYQIYYFKVLKISLLNQVAECIRKNQYRIRENQYSNQGKSLSAVRGYRQWLRFRGIILIHLLLVVMGMWVNLKINLFTAMSGKPPPRKKRRTTPSVNVESPPT